MPYLFRSPLNLRGSAVLSLGKNQSVGYPVSSTPSTSLRDPSTLAITMFGFMARVLAAASQSGAICLQCPHQGAQNLTKYSLSSLKTTSLKFFPTKTLTNPSSFSGIGADLRSLLTYPALTLVTNSSKLCLLMSLEAQRYFWAPWVMKTMTGVLVMSTPRYSANLLKWSALLPLFKQLQYKPESSASADKIN